MTAPTKAELIAENERLQKRVAALERAKARSAAQARELKTLRDALRDAEERLRLDEERYDAAMRSVNEGIYDWDVAGGLIYFSDRLQAAVGMTHENNRSPQDWRARIHPDDLPEFDRLLLDHFKGRSERFECDYRYRALDGSWSWARQHGIAIIGTDARVSRMVGSTGDITAVKQTEAVLKASEERYKLAMSAATEGIYEWNVATGDLYLSDRAKELWGFPAGVLKNADWLAHIHPDDVAAYRRTVIAHFTGQEPQVDMEMRVRDAKGDYRWVRDRGTAVRDSEGRAIRLVGAVGDITELRRAEEALRRAHEEVKGALEQQTAISEILRVISSSPSDVQPVLDAVVERAARICGAFDASIFFAEPGQLRIVARFGSIGSGAVGDTRPLDRGLPPARAVLDGCIVHVEDLQGKDGEEFPVGRARATQWGVHTVLNVPLMREGRALGAISVRRAEVRPFDARHIGMLQTFADQAAIAIENVRLFTVTREALEQQTASAEILRVIASSPSDVQPVLDAINEIAARVCGASDSVISLREGDFLRYASHWGSIPTLPMGTLVPLSAKMMSSRTILEGRQFHILDLQAETEEFPESSVRARAVGYRTNFSTPLLRDGVAIGAIVQRRVEACLFTDKQVSLLQTFADQAVIAIENVRLFRELAARTEQLTRSVEQLTALGEVGRAISSTLDMDTVLKTIVSRAVQLAGLDAGVIYEYDEAADRFVLRAAENFDEATVLGLQAAEIRKGEGAIGTSAATGEPTQVPDILDPAYPVRLRGLFERAGVRAILAVPLVREDTVVGALMVVRASAGAFAPETVDLLKTFAAQSALAIQNARLFREIAEKGRQLETASRHKSDFLASMSHELRTPLNAILGFIELILGEVYGEVPADMQEPLTDIQASGKHLLRLINNVLDLAKIEAGRMELALSDYSVHDTVESVRQTLRPLAAEKGLEFVVSLPEDLPLAYGDGGRLTQCLMNLAGNSLKFTKVGRVEISVALAGETLVYRVVDTGIGIPPDKIDSLFTEFKQTDATIASEYGGTGLGLSISRKFVEMHGGRIWIESELGRGSAFIFEVPLRVTAEAST